MPRAIARRRAAAWIAAAAGLALGTASTATAVARAAPGPRPASVARNGSGTRPDPHRLRIHILGVRGGRVRLTVATAGATDYNVRIVVRCERRTIAAGRLTTAGPRRRTVSLTVRRGSPTRGRLTVLVSAQRHSPVARTSPLAQTTS